MGNNDQRKLDSLIRAQDFFGNNGVAIGPVATSAAKQQIDDAVSQIRAHVTDQGATTRAIAGQNGLVAGLAKDLRQSHIMPITKFARANLKGVSDYATLTKTPDPATTKKMVSQSFAIAKAAAPYASAMATAGFPADTVDQLLAATNALNDAIVKREPMRVSRVQSTGSIDKLLQQGREAVRKIDGVLSKRLVGDAPTLAAWKSASRVDAKGGAVRKPAVVKPATTTPAAATPVKTTPVTVTPVTTTPAAVTPVAVTPAVVAPVSAPIVTTSVATK